MRDVSVHTHKLPANPRTQEALNNMIAAAIDYIKQGDRYMINVNDLSEYYEWHDFPGVSPRPVYWVRLDDGREMRALSNYGDWETLDGRVLIGVRQWKPCSFQQIKSTKKE